MREPSVRTSRQALAGGIAAVLIVGGGGFLLGRGTSERQVIVAPQAPADRPPAVVAPPAEVPAKDILERMDIITLAAKATDAFAAGTPAPSEILDAAGRRFDIRLPFGCEGSAGQDSAASMRWRYDADRKALRLHAGPTSWTIDDWWPDSATAPQTVEGIEGFWIARPWTGSETCPPARAPVAQGLTPKTPPGQTLAGQALAGQTLALAQFFSADDARQGRRDGRAFETVVKVEPDALQTARGFRLRITGRIANIPGGGPVLCRQPAGADQRPICVIAAEVSEVAIENGATGAVLATWNTDRKDGAGTR